VSATLLAATRRRNEKIDEKKATATPAGWFMAYVCVGGVQLRASLSKRRSDYCEDFKKDSNEHFLKASGKIITMFTKKG
jgi:hypothetical protein